MSNDERSEAFDGREDRAAGRTNGMVVGTGRGRAQAARRRIAPSIRALATVGIGMAMLGGAACASLGRAAFTEPVVTLKDVRLRGLGMTGGAMDVVLSVYNPNRFALDATQLRYQVQVDSLPFADGVLDSRFTVQSGDSSTVTIPVSFTYAGVGQAARSAINTGVVNYRVYGDVRVATPVGSFAVPYDRTGRFTTFGDRRD